MSEITIDTPTGPITIVEREQAITRLYWGKGGTPDPEHGRSGPTPFLNRAAKQIQDYFAGCDTPFELPLSIEGTTFQKQVCAAISAIPYGQTRTYGDLARKLDVSAQAIGRGCGANPIPLLIPCHRVLGAKGLGGYSGGVGIETKVWLLRLEGAGSVLL